MSGIGIALAVAGLMLSGVTFLAFVGLLAAGLGLTEHADAVAEAVNKTDQRCDHAIF